MHPSAGQGWMTVLRFDQVLLRLGLASFVPFSPLGFRPRLGFVGAVAVVVEVDDETAAEVDMSK